LLVSHRKSRYFHSSLIFVVRVFRVDQTFTPTVPPVSQFACGVEAADAGIDRVLDATEAKAAAAAALASAQHRFSTTKLHHQLGSGQSELQSDAPEFVSVAGHHSTRRRNASAAGHQKQILAR